jgi:hypothetical protein
MYGRELRPGGVAVRALEDGALGRQPLQVRRGAPVVAIKAHPVRSGAVDDVEDDVGIFGPIVSRKGRGEPERDASILRRIVLECQFDGLARQMTEID